MGTPPRASFLQSVIMSVWLLLLLGSAMAGKPVNFGELDCDGDVCLPKNVELTIEHSRTTKSGLSYKERDIGMTSDASMRDILSLCLPGIATSFIGDSFLSCNGRFTKQERAVCILAKRGWFMEDVNTASVANTDLLLSNFGVLEGAEEAVRECLNDEKTGKFGQSANLESFGLTNMPSPSTIEGLKCVKKKMDKLVSACAYKEANF